MSDQELPASSGTNSSSQNDLICRSRPIGQRTMAANIRASGKGASVPQRASVALQENWARGLWPSHHPSRTDSGARPPSKKTMNMMMTSRPG